MPLCCARRVNGKIRIRKRARRIVRFISPLLPQRRVAKFEASSASALAAASGCLRRYQKSSQITLFSFPAQRGRAALLEKAGPAKARRLDSDSLRLRLDGPKREVGDLTACRTGATTMRPAECWKAFGRREAGKIAWVPCPR